MRNWLGHPGYHDVLSVFLIDLKLGFIFHVIGYRPANMENMRQLFHVCCSDIYIGGKFSIYYNCYEC